MYNKKIHLDSTCTDYLIKLTAYLSFLENLSTDSFSSEEFKDFRFGLQRILLSFIDKKEFDVNRRHSLDEIFSKIDSKNLDIKNNLTGAFLIQVKETNGNYFWLNYRIDIKKSLFEYAS